MYPILSCSPSPIDIFLYFEFLASAQEHPGGKLIVIASFRFYHWFLISNPLRDVLSLPLKKKKKSECVDVTFDPSLLFSTGQTPPVL